MEAQWRFNVLLFLAGFWVLQSAGSVWSGWRCVVSPGPPRQGFLGVGWVILADLGGLEAQGRLVSPRLVCCLLFVCLVLSWLSFYFCTHCKMTTMNHRSSPVKKATKRRRDTKCDEPTGSYPRTQLRKTSNNMQQQRRICTSLYTARKETCPKYCSSMVLEAVHGQRPKPLVDKLACLFSFPMLYPNRFRLKLEAWSTVWGKH